MSVSCGRRWCSWKTKPIRRLRNSAWALSERACGSTPSSATLPPLGGSSAPRMKRSVLFPEPDGPVTASSSPGPRASVTSSRTVSGPAGAA